MRKIFTPLACSLLIGISLTACSNENPQTTDTTFQLNSSILPTRAPQLNANGGGTFSKNDENTLLFQAPQGTLVKSFTYIYGKTYYWNELNLPSSHKELQVSGCYPTITTSTPTLFAWDVRNASVTADLLLAPPISVTPNTTQDIRLQFNHAMHQLQIELKADGATLQQAACSQAKLTCRNFLPIVNVNLLQGAVISASGDKSSLQATGDKATFILPPQAVGNIQLQVQLSGREYTFDLATHQIAGSPITQLESGKSIKLTITVSKTSFSVTGQNIGAWESQGESNGSIIL